MEWILLIFLVALIPTILSLVLIRRAKQRFHNRIRRIRQRYQYYHHHRLDSSSSSDSPEHYQEAIGDVSCVHNARSPYLRCAINPYGPCEGCTSYESRKRDKS